jgi:hypothetical protein
VWNPEELKELIHKFGKIAIKVAKYFLDIT